MLGNNKLNRGAISELKLRLEDVNSKVSLSGLWKKSKYLD